MTDRTTYRFRVQAINAVANRGYSNLTKPVTPTPGAQTGIDSVAVATTLAPELAIRR